MIASSHPRMQEIQQMIERIGPTDLPVLITGETGTGKEVVARQLVARSPRSKGPFVKINCAALPRSLVESELYGHARGAFTGADLERDGLVTRADGGTLFVDEIGEMDLSSQSKLLHLIEDGVIAPMGQDRGIQLNIRYIAATNRDLEAAVRENTFRKDLYFRLSVIRIDLPPLRDRKDDIRTLVETFLAEFAEAYGLRRSFSFSRAQWERLEDHPWPGNIRELKNWVETLVIVGNLRSAFETLHPSESVPEEDLSSPSLMKARKAAEVRLERKVIRKVLERNGWDRMKTAKTLKISYRSLLSKMKDLHLR